LGYGGWIIDQLGKAVFGACKSLQSIPAAGKQKPGIEVASQIA
jgi:hypothetical protein